MSEVKTVEEGERFPMVVRCRRTDPKCFWNKNGFCNKTSIVIDEDGVCQRYYQKEKVYKVT